MAVTRKKTTGSMLISVHSGSDKHGNPVYTTRIVPNVSSGLSDDDAFAIGKEIAALQKHTFHAIERNERSTLEEG